MDEECKARKIDAKHWIKSFWKSSLERIADSFDFSSNRYDIKTIGTQFQRARWSWRPPRNLLQYKWWKPEWEKAERCVVWASLLYGVSHRSIIQLLEIFGARDRVYMVVGLGPEREFFDRLHHSGILYRAGRQNPHVVADGMRYVHASRITQQGPKAWKLLHDHPGVDSNISTSRSDWHTLGTKWVTGQWGFSVGPQST